MIAAPGAFHASRHFVYLIAAIVLLCSNPTLATENPSPYNPSTAGVDIPPAGANQSDATLKQACKEQKGRQLHIMEYCQHRCAGGEKKFCDCAKDPCSKFSFDDEKPAPPPPGDTAAGDSPSSAGRGIGKCGLPDSKLPKIEGYGPDRYVPKEWPDSIPVKSRVEYLEYICSQDTVGSVGSLRACKVLCKMGCKSYCNYCEIASKPCGRGKKQRPYCGFGGAYQFLETSLVPDGVDQAPKGTEGIWHNCNPKTKKRGVGIIPGGDETFIGLGYGDVKYSVGACNELLQENFRPLRLAFDAGDLGSKEEYDGIPTFLEMVWACGHIPMCGPFFKKWNYPIIKGATRENPLRPGDLEYDLVYQYVAPLKPGLNSYDVPPYPDGKPRFLCGESAWIDSTGDEEYQRKIKSDCVDGGDLNTCRMLCNRGAGHEEFCEAGKLWGNIKDCERYGGPGVYHNVPACNTLCNSGKPEYQKYCD